MMLLYMACVANASCQNTATPANGTVFVASGNTLSGLIRFSSYTDNNYCYWQVRCPSATVFTISNFTLNVEQGYDWLYLRHVDEGGRGQTLMRYSGSRTSLNAVTNSSTVEITFLSDTGLSAGYTGASLGFACLPRPSVCQSQRCRTGGDAWNCSLPLQCPTAMEVLSLGDSVRSNIVTDVQIEAAQVGLRPYRFPSIPYTGLQNTTAYATACEDRYSWLYVPYECVSSRRCQSPNASITYITSTPGTLLSDADGHRTSTRLNTQQSCYWLVDCQSSAQVVYVYGYTAFTSSLSSLQFLESTGKSTLSTIEAGQSNGTGVPFGPLHFSQSSLSIVFSQSGTDAFSLNYYCGGATCTSMNVSGSTYTAASGVIRSDTDGIGSMPYNNGENCSWTVQCPVGEVFTMEDVEISSEASHDRLSVVDSTGATIWSLSGSRFLPWYHTLNQTVTVRFISDSSIRGSGFTLNYRCIPRNQVNASVVGTPRPPTPAPLPPIVLPPAGTGSCPDNNAVLEEGVGTIVSDSDGAGPINYVNNQRCRWNILCPDGEAVVIRNFILFTESCCDYVTISDIRSGYRYGQYRGTQRTPIDLVTQSQYLTVYFYTDGSVVHDGFGLQFTCTSVEDLPTVVPSYSPPGNRYCSATVPPLPNSPSFPITGSQGWIKSDSDGRGGSNYRNSEDCRWNIACSAGRLLYVTELNVDTESGYDDVYLARYATTSRLVTWTGSEKIGERSEPYATGYQNVTVGFETDASVTDNGFSLQWTCMNTSERAYYSQLLEWRREEKAAEVALGLALGFGVPAGIFVLVLLACGCSVLMKKAEQARAEREMASRRVAAGLPADPAPYPSDSVSRNPGHVNIQAWNARQDEEMAVIRGREGSFIWTRDISMTMSEAENPSQPMCILCLTHRPKYAMIPCGHLVLCQGCHESFEPRDCPICRTRCTASMRVTFLPRVDGNVAKCLMCQSQEAECAPVPCGHVCLCKSCSPSICPACTGPTESVIEIFK